MIELLIDNIKSKEQESYEITLCDSISLTVNEQSNEGNYIGTNLSIQNMISDKQKYTVQLQNTIEGKEKPTMKIDFKGAIEKGKINKIKTTNMIYTLTFIED